MSSSVRHGYDDPCQRWAYAGNAADGMHLDPTGFVADWQPLRLATADENRVYDYRKGRETKFHSINVSIQSNNKTKFIFNQSWRESMIKQQKSTKSQRQANLVSVNGKCRLLNESKNTFCVVCKSLLYESALNHPSLRYGNRYELAGAL